jgi:sec-independent protein translocase protein TatA
MQTIAFLQNLSSWEIILIFLVVLLFFGAKRLPDLSRSFGKSIREFKKATSDIESDIRTAMDEEPEGKKSSKARPSAKTDATTAPKEVEAEDIAAEIKSDDVPEKDPVAPDSDAKDKAKSS